MPKIRVEFDVAVSERGVVDAWKAGTTLRWAGRIVSYGRALKIGESTPIVDSYGNRQGFIQVVDDDHD